MSFIRPEFFAKCTKLEPGLCNTVCQYLEDKSCRYTSAMEIYPSEIDTHIVNDMKNIAENLEVRTALLITTYVDLLYYIVLCYEVSSLARYRP